MKQVFRICPVCSCNTGDVLHNQHFALIHDSPLPDNYDIISCQKCGFVFADTHSTQQDYNLYYSVLSKYEDNNISSGSAFDKNDYERLLRTAVFIEKHIGKHQSILDLGCANGGLLMILKDKGFTDLTGIDPSKNCVINVQKKGINAIQTDLFSSVFASMDSKFDLIILSHVMEHIRDLENAILIIKTKLNQNGLIYVEVPDASRYKDFYIVPFYYVDCEHINHFSPVSMNNLFEKYGFRKVDFVQGTINVKDKIEYPVFYSLFENSNTPIRSITFDVETTISFNEFINKSKNNSRSQIFKEIANSPKDVIIWGAGQYALRLLSESEFPKEKIIAFIDSDSSKHNRKIQNIEIYSPEYIIGKDCILLICSALHSEEIAKRATSLNKNIAYYIL